MVTANGCPWDEETCADAAEGGYLEMLQWLRSNGCPWDERTSYLAAEFGRLNVLQWALSNGCPYDRDKLCSTKKVKEWLIAGVLKLL